MKKILIAAIILLVLAVAGGLVFLRHTPFAYSGVVEAVEVDVPSRLSDTITQINVQEGSPVKKGEVLARLDCRDTRLKAEIAAKEFKRAETLLKTTAGSRENYDLKKHQNDQAALYATWCDIASPLTGKVLYRYYEPGEFVAAGRKILTVADLSEVDVWVYVEHDLLARLQAGQKVKGFLPETGQTFEGIILAINDEAEFTPKNVQTRRERERLVYGVKTRFQNDNTHTLKSGMTLEVSFEEAQ